MYLLFDTYYGECGCAGDELMFSGAFTSLDAAQDSQIAQERYGKTLNPWTDEPYLSEFPRQLPYSRDPTGFERAWRKGSWLVVEIHAIEVGVAPTVPTDA